MKTTGQIKFLCVLSALCGFVVLFSVNGSASVQQIGPDLYAYISDNDASANSTFLVSDRGILVVDTGLNAQEGGKLLAEIRKISQAPVHWTSIRITIPITAAAIAWSARMRLLSARNSHAERQKSRSKKAP